MSRDMMGAFELYQPDSVEGAVELLSKFGKDGWALAGGNDSFDWFKDRIKRPKYVVDLGGIAALKGIRETPDGGVEISWEAAADFESGIQQFIIECDGKEIGRVPPEPKGKFGRALFQNMSFHDTPEAPLPAMKFLDKAAKAGEKHEYGVITVNSVGLKSEAGKSAP